MKHAGVISFLRVHATTMLAHRIHHCAWPISLSLPFQVSIDTLSIDNVSMSMKWKFVGYILYTPKIITNRIRAMGLKPWGSTSEKIKTSPVIPKLLPTGSIGWKSYLLFFNKSTRRGLVEAGALIQMAQNQRTLITILLTRGTPLLTADCWLLRRNRPHKCLIRTQIFSYQLLTPLGPRDIRWPLGNSWDFFTWRSGGWLPGELHAGTCGKDYQLAMVVVEGGDIFVEGWVVELVEAYRRRKK